MRGFSKKRCYCNEMEDLEDSLTACRDNDHDKVAIIFQIISKIVNSTKLKKHAKLPNK